MWIVRLALRRPYTFVVAALLLLLMTPFVITKTPTDIFPAINIPVVSVIWSYTGLPADQIAQRLVYSEERALTTTVDNIEHIESTSYDSFGVIKVFFQPGTNPSTAVAQLTAVSQTILRQLPPGTTPPLIIQYSASTLSVATGVKAAMANILKTVTSDIQVKQFADQSVFVKAAVSGVVREGVIAAALTALMILLFLGSWRSTLITVSYTHLTLP